MSLEAQLLVSALNELRQLVWMQSEDAQKKRNRPQPVLLPSQAQTNQDRDQRVLDRGRRFRARQQQQSAEEVTSDG